MKDCTMILSEFFLFCYLEDRLFPVGSIVKSCVKNVVYYSVN